MVFIFLIFPFSCFVGSDSGELTPVSGDSEFAYQNQEESTNTFEELKIEKDKRENLNSDDSVKGLIITTKKNIDDKRGGGRGRGRMKVTIKNKKITKVVVVVEVESKDETFF